MKVLSCAILWIIAFNLTAFAQEGMIGINFNAGFPTGDFKTEVGSNIFPAIGINGLYQIPKTPFFVGGELSYSRYGTQMTRSNNIINGTEQRFRIRRNNNAMHLSGVVRVMPETSFRVRPFVEGQLGGIHTFTRSRVRENSLAEPLSSGTELSAWAMLYQFGGGLMVPIERWKETFIELKVNYVHSGKMNILIKNMASYNDQGQVTLSPVKTAFQLIQPSVGLKFAL